MTAVPDSPDERFMRQALREAERGRGRTHPNPIVGALIVRAGRVLARGHHEKAGGPHAEVVALRRAGARARGADVYVTLEPHDHQGRTPPCTEALIAAGVRRVFIGSIDPNPLVRGRGIRRMRRAGLEVVPGVLREECDRANEQWFKFITTGLPWVVLKAAVTLDGKLATKTGDSRWVTGPEARRLVHCWRDQLDAVLVGAGTALADDPLLTARLPGARHPIRVVADTSARLPVTARMLRAPGETWVMTGKPREARAAALERAGARVFKCKTKGPLLQLKDVLRTLAREGVTSVLVEGGARLHGSLLAAGLWDELRLFLAPKIAGSSGLSWAGFPGARAMEDALALRDLRVSPKGPDVLVLARPRRPV